MRGTETFQYSSAKYNATRVLKVLHFMLQLHRKPAKHLN